MCHVLGLPFQPPSPTYRAMTSCSPPVYRVPPRFWSFYPHNPYRGAPSGLNVSSEDGMAWYTVVVTAHTAFLVCKHAISVFPPHAIKYVFYVQRGKHYLLTPFHRRGEGRCGGGGRGIPPPLSCPSITSAYGYACKNEAKVQKIGGNMINAGGT